MLTCVALDDFVDHSVTSHNTASSESWALLNTWFCDCLEGHDACRSPESAQDFMPTRLIDVSYRETENVRIVENVSLPARYVALSHCWGKEPNLTLVTRDPQDGTSHITLTDAREGLPIDRLPRTYQDAVRAARRLSVQYLWIDSLCILQDSEDDWARESKRMAGVYGNAFCTFTAAGSAGSSGGMFHDRLPSLVQRVVVAPRWDSLIQDTYTCDAMDF